MFPSECVLERRVRSDGDEDLAGTNLPLFILKCEHRKADGYADHELELYTERLQGMAIGVRLADAPPAVSYLAVLGAQLFAEIETVDRNVIVITLGRRRRRLRALVLTGRLANVDEADFLYLWRPSSSSPHWSEKKEPSFLDWGVDDIDKNFSFNGDAYWVDLLWGVSYYSCDALFDDDIGVLEFGFIPLPLEPDGDYRDSKRVAHPEAYRTMGVVCDSISTKDTDVIYLVLGECRENPFDFKFIPNNVRYLLAVDMPKKIITSVPLTRYMFPDPFVSFGFSQYISKALV
ncbi:hypothetical protein ACQ4PT_034627 [Festuca glaucescens]